MSIGTEKSGGNGGGLLGLVVAVIGLAGAIIGGLTKEKKDKG